jgi:hypothetical protein
MRLSGVLQLAPNYSDRDIVALAATRCRAAPTREVLHNQAARGAFMKENEARVDAKYSALGA